MSGRTRRTVLGSVVGALALAGCSESTSLGSDVFERVAVEGTELVVEFTSADVADELSVIDPNGSSFAERSLAAGETLVTVELGVGYAPGEYEVLALEEGEEVATTRTTIQPDLEIVDAAVGANYPEEMPENLPFPENQLQVDIRNSGTGPGAIMHLGIEGDVPNPVPISESESSGIFDVEEGMGDVDEFIIGTEERATLFSSTYPFADSDAFCDGSEVVVILQTAVSSDRIESRFRINYDPDSEGNCRVSIDGDT